MIHKEMSLFAVTAPGLEGVCAAELTALGLAGEEQHGGVAFAGGLRELYLANLWLRSASRVLVRVAEIKSRDFPDLFNHLRRLPWGRFIKAETRVRVRASSHRSRLQHTGRIAETVAEAVDRALGRAQAPHEGEEQLVLARFEDDVCLLSVDASGELLHRRGYREETAHAPLRETLAAGILLLLGWDGSETLVDPMCGSGSFPIEAALLARRRPPGAERSFAFMNWPRYRPGLWQALLSEALRRQRSAPVAILGRDRDGAAVAAARRNAARAGEGETVRIEDGKLAELELPGDGPGLLLCNPPYGERLGRDEDLVALYRTLGVVGCRPGWRMAFICPDPALARATGLAVRPVAQLVNGGIPVTLYAGG
jgi:putative N6-adenine-specific DNA methylase